jgi:hypothetical protein
MFNNSIVEILDNLTKLDLTFARVFVENTFKGNQKKYLNQFLDDQLTREGVIQLWDEVNWTGEIVKDVLIEELSTVDRLKLLAFILNKLGVNSTSLEEVYINKIEPEEAVKALALLLNSLMNTDKIRVRNKESQEELVAKLKVKKEPIIIQDCLIPHAPTNTTTKVEEEDDEEIFDVDSVTV